MLCDDAQRVLVLRSPAQIRCIVDNHRETRTRFCVDVLQNLANAPRAAIDDGLVQSHSIKERLEHNDRLFEWKTVEVTSEELDGVLTDEICSNALTDLLGGDESRCW